MSKEPILVIMAAGMGSRYGGLKQMDPIGPASEVILHYSIFDARRAGFKRVLFLIKPEIEADFRRMVGDRVSPYMEVTYALQQLNHLPEGYEVPAARVKPWGTGHAVLCCAEAIDAPFAVINADDYYGVSAFRTAYDTLCTLEDGARCQYMMVGYALSNTTTANGYVSRGVCVVDERGLLRGIDERTHIVESSDGPLWTSDRETYHLLPGNTIVSMNLWGFTPSILTALAEQFPAFLDTEAARNPTSAEFQLPRAVDAMLQAGRADVRVLPSADRWWGVTYAEDKPAVAAALREMTEQGLYPTPLWG